MPTPATGVARAPASPQTATSATPPAKKIGALGRGLPPPIPPNKPVIGGKQAMPRRPDVHQPTQLPQVEQSSQQPPPLPAAPDKKRPPALSPPGKDPSTTVDPLGQELADFQQMFVTMATGNN